jgi:hypothetical protein
VVTRQFRALLTLGLAWSLPWAVIGVAVALGSWAPADDPIQQMLGPTVFLILHALVYGALGVISALVFGLVWSRIGARNGLSGSFESGAYIAGLSGGLTPFALCGLLALSLGALNLALLPIVTGGLMRASLSGGLTTSRVGLATRAVPIELEKKSVSYLVLDPGGTMDIESPYRQSWVMSL